MSSNSPILMSRRSRPRTSQTQKRLSHVAGRSQHDLAPETAVTTVDTTVVSVRLLRVIRRVLVLRVIVGGLGVTTDGTALLSSAAPVLGSGLLSTLQGTGASPVLVLLRR